VKALGGMVHGDRHRLLLPFEIIEIIRRFSVAKPALLVANAAVFAYLIWQLKRQKGWRRNHE
jgi:uncharacterized membrane protein (DUF2068 family)